MTVRGLPQHYYGDEIGMTGNKESGDGDIRKDFPGGWRDDRLNAFVPEGRTTEQSNYFEFTKKLLQWRKTSRAVHYGKFLHFIPVNGFVYG